MSRVRVTIDRDDRGTRGVVTVLSGAIDESEVEIRDARDDPDAAAFLDRLVCCGRVDPVVECDGLVLTGPNPAEALAAVRRVAPDLVR
jgi:hypothetical protein